MDCFPAAGFLGAYYLGSTISVSILLTSSVILEASHLLYLLSQHSALQVSVSVSNHQPHDWVARNPSPALTIELALSLSNHSFHVLGPCNPKYGPWINNINITQELVRKAESLAPP